MATMMLTEREVMERLRAAVTSAGGQRRFAAAHGFTPAYVHDVLHGKRGLAQRILDALGIERVVSYREKPVC
jgi:hypothetical protein